VCHNLKELRRLEVKYENVHLANVEELNTLENLQELCLVQLQSPGGGAFPSAEFQEFCENVFRIFPRLQSCMSYDFGYHVPQVQVNELNDQEVFPLEQCEVTFHSNEDM